MDRIGKKISEQIIVNIYWVNISPHLGLHMFYTMNRKSCVNNSRKSIRKVTSAYFRQLI